jgi:hypothetical protein
MSLPGRQVSRVLAREVTRPLRVNIDRAYGKLVTSATGKELSSTASLCSSRRLVAAKARSLMSMSKSSVRAPRWMSTWTQKHRVFLALGSNMGDRIKMIEAAYKLIDQHESMRVVRTSCLWETKAMYVVDQADFLNAACEVGKLTSSSSYHQNVHDL